MSKTPNFSTPHNAAFHELGGQAAGQQWSAFDVSMSTAERDGANVLVTTIWNYYIDKSDSAGEPHRIPAVQRDRQSGDLWYRLAEEPKTTDSGTSKAHRHRLDIALEESVPIVGFLKDLETGAAALNAVFDCTMVAYDIQRPGALWVQLTPRVSCEFEVGDFNVRDVATLEQLLPTVDEVLLLGEQPRPDAEQPNGPYRYGSKRTWEIVLDGLIELDGAASMAEIKRVVLAKIPGFELGNFFPDLSMLSVNSASRGQYGVNVRPRRTDSGSEYDQIYREGRGRQTVYKLYDITRDGVWELYRPLIGKKLKVRQIEDPLLLKLEEAEREAEQAGIFDPTDIEDARSKTLAAVVRRRGQSAFRDALRNAYEDRCCLTDCNLVDVLEAAHIHPYRGDQTNVVSNGLLLRADIHTLFDLFLLRIDPTSLTVHVSPKLIGTEYASLQGRRITTPVDPGKAPSPKALKVHANSCAWYSAHPGADAAAS
jgi:hypothetical protein